MRADGILRRQERAAIFTAVAALSSVALGVVGLLRAPG
jgi:hypothetical protein